MAILYSKNLVTYNDTNDQYNIPHLDMHWAVYIPSTYPIGIGPMLVIVTIFEFISARSPHSMKGLLLETYFAITGIFQFISSALLLPFPSRNFWAGGHYPPHTGCLFGYFISTCVISLIAFVPFIIAAKWYVYQERDNRPYDQRFVIDVYDRYLNPADDHGPSYDSDSY